MKLYISLGLIFIFAFSVFGQIPKAPSGWRFPQAKDMKGLWKENKKDTPMPYKISGDFNADKLKDEVWILIPTSRKGSGLFVFLGQINKSFRSVQIEYSEDGKPQDMYLSVADKGKYDTACGKGYWDCKEGESPVLNLKSQGIWYGLYESSASIFYWDVPRKTFERIWISD